jgi:hypothetical protein
MAELRFSIARLPAAKRRDVLRDRLESTVLSAFSG